jgi:hypothetical protein
MFLITVLTPFARLILFPIKENINEPLGGFMKLVSLVLSVVFAGVVAQANEAAPAAATTAPAAATTTEAAPAAKTEAKADKKAAKKHGKKAAKEEVKKEEAAH